MRTGTVQHAKYWQLFLSKIQQVIWINSPRTFLFQSAIFTARVVTPLVNVSVESVTRDTSLILIQKPVKVSQYITKSIHTKLKAVNILKYYLLCNFCKYVNCITQSSLEQCCHCTLCVGEWVCVCACVCVRACVCTVLIPGLCQLVSAETTWNHPSSAWERVNHCQLWLPFLNRIE